MSQRSKNLLEAFNQSKAPEKSAEPVAPPRGSAPKVGGPFADSAPMARPKEQPLLHGARSDSSRSPRERLRVVVLCTGIALIFFFVGRASAPSVGAAEKPPAPAPGAPAEMTQTPPAAKPINLVGNDTALVDLANQSTILACSYKFSAENKTLAMASRARLIEQGLPASVYENQTKKQIFILVGAAPRQSDLDGLLVRVKSATSDRAKQEFKGAYAVPIDNYVVRKTH